MQRIVVLGGGVGGSVAANNLARKLAADLEKGQVTIQMITDKPDHVYKPAFLYIPFGRTTPKAYRRPQRELLDPAVELIVDPVTKVDTSQQQVMTASGTSYGYDQLIIATGSRVMPELTPGLQEAAHVFYTEEAAVRLHQNLKAFTAGRVVVSVVGAPHMCPVAPLEITFMLDAFFRAQGTRDNVDIIYTYPINRVHTIPSCAAWASSEFQQRGVKTETFFNVEHVDPDKRVIETMEGESLNFDLLIAIPEHRSAQFLTDSGLAKDGWVPTDRYNLRVDGYDNVWAVGDTTDLPVSKAGSVAHYQASVVANQVAAAVHGKRCMERYDGKTFCFIESGFDEATYVQFDYTHPATPVRPSKLVHWSKLAYNNTYWLTARGVV